MEKVLDKKVPIEKHDPRPYDPECVIADNVLKLNELGWELKIRH